jgi:hypothetical protein
MRQIAAAARSRRMSKRGGGGGEGGGPKYIARRVGYGICGSSSGSSGALTPVTSAPALPEYHRHGARRRPPRPEGLPERALSPTPTGETLPGVEYHEVTGDHPDLEEWAMGEWVLYAQQLLKQEGFEPGDHKMDGKFGPFTAAAVRAFQNAREVDATARINRETWDVLEGKRINMTLYLGPHLVFDSVPEIDWRGFLVWTVKNIGGAVAPARTSSGNYDLTHNNTSVPGGDTSLPADLAVDTVSGQVAVDVSGYADGDYQVTVQLGDHVEYVNFRVVGGVAEPDH